MNHPEQVTCSLVEKNFYNNTYNSMCFYCNCQELSYSQEQYFFSKCLAIKKNTYKVQSTFFYKYIQQKITFLMNPMYKFGLPNLKIKKSIFCLRVRYLKHEKHLLVISVKLFVCLYIRRTFW